MQENLAEIQRPTSSFHPALGCKGPHRMTLAGFAAHRLSRNNTCKPERLSFRTEPDCSVEADAYWQPERRAADTLLVLHGLGGSSRSGYVLTTRLRAQVESLNVIALNTRNCGDTEHLTRTLYHAGLIQDVLAVIEQLTDLDGPYRLKPLHLLGFSMGGNQALLCGTTPQAETQLASITTISPALDLGACSRAVDVPRSNRIYRRYLVSGLKATLKKRERLFPGERELDRLEQVRTLRDFDQRFTAPSFGFQDVDDYYAQASSLHHLSNLRVPCTAIMALDDPMVPYREILPNLPSQPLLATIVTEHGGHCAFLASTSKQASGNSKQTNPIRSNRFWAEELAIKQVQAQRS